MQHEEERGRGGCRCRRRYGDEPRTGTVSVNHRAADGDVAGEQGSAATSMAAENQTSGSGANRALRTTPTSTPDTAAAKQPAAGGGGGDSGGGGGDKRARTEVKPTTPYFLRSSVVSPVSSRAPRVEETPAKHCAGVDGGSVHWAAVQRAASAVHTRDAGEWYHKQEQQQQQQQHRRRAVRRRRLALTQSPVKEQRREASLSLPASALVQPRIADDVQRPARCRHEDEKDTRTVHRPSAADANGGAAAAAADDEEEEEEEEDLRCEVRDELRIPDLTRDEYFTSIMDMVGAPP